MTDFAGHSAHPHIVVIGAGIVGASIALHLALRNVRLTVVDAAQPGQAATAVSFGWINSRDKQPRHYHELGRRSLDMWYRLVHRLGGDLGMHWGGELRWAATDEGARRLIAGVRQLQSWGYPIRQIDADDIRRLEPGLDTGRVTAASYIDVEGHVDTAKVVRACLDKATQRGAELCLDTTVTALHLAQDASGRSRVEAVGTQSGDIPCDLVVLAAGADIASLTAMAGLNLPYQHTFGATILTQAVSPVLRHVAVVHTPRDLPPPQMNLRQLSDGTCMIHGGSHDGSLGKTPAEVEQVLQATQRFWPALQGVQIREVRQGRRPMPQDGQPILGFAAAVPNLYVAATHSGVTLAALIGECAAIEILDGVRIDFLEPYRIERFAR